MKTLSALVTASLLAVPAASFAAEYDLDPAHSQVGFSTKHLVVSTVRGEFGKISGTVTYDEKKPEASVVDITIDTTSINTREPKRDGHLKSADFFDVEKFPTATFKSKKVVAAGKGKLKVEGELTLKGITKPVTLAVTGPSAEVKTPFGTTIVAASATATISRKDFGMVWNKALETGGLMVGDDVQLTIEAELVKRAAKPAL